MSDLPRIRIEHQGDCLAVEGDWERCTCEPGVYVQIGGRDKGWSSLSGALPRGWTKTHYDELRRYVLRSQRPNTDAENEEIVRKKMGWDEEPER